MKFENTEVFNFEGAIRGLRFPMQSGAKADSHYCLPNECIQCKGQEPRDNSYHWDICTGEDISWTPYKIGSNDMDLCQRMIRAGSPNDKYLRQIMVAVDIQAPLYWWKEADTYKVGTVADSESTMHKLASTPITIDCFETDDYNPDLIFETGIDDRGDNPWGYELQIKDQVGICEENSYWGETIIGFLESLRKKYLETKDIHYWKELIRWLPESWLQKRHWTANYAVLRNMYYWRVVVPHKLTEWQTFGRWVESLPYAKELIMYDMK